MGSGSSLLACCCLGGGASATLLEDSVLQYNQKASLVEGAWDDFQTKQAAAFADVKDWLDALHEYFSLAGVDDEAADAAWEDAETAWSHLENTTSVPTDLSYATLIQALQDAQSALEAVVTADQADLTAKAYSCGDDYFDVPSQPVPFWNDPEYPDFEEWPQLQFPYLCVGDNTHVSFLLSTNPILEWLEAIEWLHLGYWMNEHKDDGRKFQHDAKNRLDEICCQCKLGAMYALDWCFTYEAILGWCNEEKKTEHPICDGNQSDSEANTDLGEAFPCWMQIQVGKVADTAQSYIKSVWCDEFSWL